MGLETDDVLIGRATLAAWQDLMVIVEAVRQAGLDRQRIRDALADIDYGAAITGRIRFDAKGNRVADATEEAGVSDG